MNTTITQSHQSKPAYIYVRQSSPGQVRHNQESTERQYALQDKALAMGWPRTSIRVLDRDLGRSGAHAAGREDFKTLVADVSMGQVGAVFALEVSRLARSNLDWHRLLELCALTHTLVIDADGCYDPADFNDGLVLGIKGTMAQAELHLMRGRLLGGKLNKAQKGELRVPLPIGFCYDDEDRIVRGSGRRGPRGSATGVSTVPGRRQCVPTCGRPDGSPRTVYGSPRAPMAAPGPARLIWGQTCSLVSRSASLHQEPRVRRHLRLMVAIAVRQDHHCRMGEVHKSHAGNAQVAEWRVQHARASRGIHHRRGSSSSNQQQLAQQPLPMAEGTVLSGRGTRRPCACCRA